MKRLCVSLVACGVMACSASLGGGLDTTGDLGCASLSVCCSQLTTGLQPLCDSVVTQGTDSACTQELGIYESSGACGGHGVDAGGPGPVFGQDGGYDVSIQASDGALGEDALASRDAGEQPDTSNSCGTCGPNCRDDCGNACTSGACRVCVPLCVTDDDCANSCPGSTEGISCCDQSTAACFVSPTDACPVAVIDAGTDSGFVY